MSNCTITRSELANVPSLLNTDTNCCKRCNEPFDYHQPGVVTLRNLLRNHLTPLTGAPKSPHATTMATTRSYPRSLRPWSKDFNADTQNFLATSGGVLDNPSRPPNDIFRNTVCLEGGIQSMIDDFYHIPMNCVAGRQFTVAGAGNIPSTFPGGARNIVTCGADRFAFDDSGVFSVIETKTFWALSQLPANKNILCDQYKSASESDDASEPRWRAISQLYGYMLDQNVSYGVLTTFNMTWLFYSSGDSLYVSDGFPCLQEASSTLPSMLQILFYFYNLARDDTTSSILHIPPSERLSGEHFGPSHEEDDPLEADSSNLCDETYHPRKSQKTMHLWGMHQYSLHDLNLRCRVGGGRYAMVFKGTLQGKPIAVKLYDVSKGGEDLLRKEMSVYHDMHQYQGRLIPKVLGVASSGGNMEGYCMEWLQSIECWTLEMKQQAKEVLKELGETMGVMQQDISEGNFAKSFENRVVMIDMEEIKFADSEKEFKSYMRRAQKVIDSF